ncbi:glycine--tRNA ligase subunit beta [Novosphingobium sp.]|jgi:glycyl-tRNA synthetase beta chain|uniref:glycine--tRNA ligase subunit beta n=1 Tax=Novosphingobium sp. TaxID=1874826 RepID=UPI0022CD11BA|nr:glycine--tRNA ligase subunit beta [Novosphingobium sp.]MCZ8017280.1 glycine--tRNA ligase subunit beta [Novosphingobium sp.]MCZ8034197.1 glycine--tRNA ligase subunit beta [Novosphingobium sp.]MCZ8051552.1 glycine--tRNA ligase subunit beta [Novosphingobium sp.]MCZ8059898.1 glycine--tRNA ligase subunit beta [Novosphingobium sp.]MCZ8231736.1 glycine--tRNA ligase subunit beta [Novosphingobium sp.]
MSDFLLELRSEEIPARMQAGARADLEKLFRKEMEAAGVAVGEVTVWSTPRRLALIARGLPAATAAVSEEVKGPRVGAPPQALEGFLRKTGLSEDQLVERDGVLFAITEKPGRATAEALAEAIPAIVRAFPWPKSQRWGAASISTESLRWVRPLSAIVALFDGQVVDCEVGGIKAGRLTRGHRFHSSGEISIDGVDDYAAKLRAAHVIVDHAERQDLIRAKASEAAAAAGLKLVADEGLVIENAGLTEWPVPLLGRFDEQFLEVPPEVIQLTARTNQKYFVCEDASGKLANAFVCTANIVASDGGAAIVAGNRKVLAARLSDARFFWEQDRKTALSDHAKKLERITFHEKLGTVADKVERVARLARWLVEEGIVKPSTVTPDLIRGPAALATAGDEAGPRVKPGVTKEELADQAELAARLCKADLVTEMVGEFPELQGLMGGYYARAEGLPDAVADAIRDHYKPVGQGDEVPTATVTVAVSLADKLDTIRSFFAIDEKPTGSKDPFALRRAALGIIQLITTNGLRFGVGEGDVLAFFADRLKVQQREAGVRHDLIDAVFALGGEDDLVRLLARVHALQAFIGTEDGTNLLAGYKRAANILKKEDFAGAQEIALSYTPEPAEEALVSALAEAGPRAAAAVAAEDFGGAMAALATLRAPIDAFFEQVTVNDADTAKRTFRLSLLARLRDAVHGVADFSKIEG